ncbi:pH-response regulator palC protein [Rutstroemia sp. NJR-2017a WRK4]|nr:pH-response regulator palC protein [Rutstroemia sp. NJR-2017a WRK4]
MPFPFTLPTTSSFSFSAYFTSDSHPSLPLAASTYRGVLRDTLKKHKRLPAAQQASNLSSIVQALKNYLPYLLALDAGLSSQSQSSEHIDIILTSTPTLEWRPTISEPPVPGREAPRLKIQSLEYEIYFVLSTLAYTHVLLSRSSLHPLYSSATSSPPPDQRTACIKSATEQLLAAASIHNYLFIRSSSLSSPPPCPDISTPVFRALSSLALAESTLLAVLKDDPYPAAVQQDRNKNDKEWMIKAPEIPKVRAHLFARLCLAAAEHAANAVAMLGGMGNAGKGKIDAELLKYVEDLRRVGRGKACRFFGVDAELGGKTGEGIGWLRAGMIELGMVTGDDGKKSGFGRLKKEWSEKREDRKVEKGKDWGSDAGRAEEGRVLEMLEKKWVKMNDTIGTQLIPSAGTLISNLPSGREMHSIKPYNPPSLDAQVLEDMRAPPDPTDIYDDVDSSDEEKGEVGAPAGAFPGTKGDYAGSTNYF